MRPFINPASDSIAIKGILKITAGEEGEEEEDDDDDDGDDDDNGDDDNDDDDDDDWQSYSAASQGY